MYASLISAGASQLYDLYKSVTASRSSTPDPSPDASTPAPASTGAVNGPSGSGASLSSALQKLFVDLQAGTSSTASPADPTSTVANDPQTVSHGLKASGHHHGHHPAGPPAANDGSAPSGNLASSLLAYTKSQSLGATSSAGLTA